MELRTLECFLSVARYLNFTKAANECYISQAALSQQIDKMERELGFRLFWRNNRCVELTEAGRSFAESAKELLEHYKTAVSNARKLAEGKAGRVRVGILCQYEYEIFSEVFAIYRVAYPEVKVDFGYVDCREMERLLRSEEIDLVLGSYWEFSGAKDLRVDKILTDPICAIMRSDDPLVDKEPLGPEDLEQKDIVMFAEENAPRVHKHMREDCRKYGFDPHFAATANTFDNMLLMVEAGLGVAMLPSRFAGRLGESMRAVKLRGSEMVHELAVGRLDRPGESAVERFYQILLRCFSAAEG